MHGSSVTSERLRGLLDAVVAMSGDLTLDRALQRIVDTASELVDARYGFLGVLDGRSNRRLGTFAVHGLDEAHRAMIGRLPEGLGLLGSVIDRPEPLRIADLSTHPDRAGFPVLHPDMTSFLGVPIRVQDRVFGNLYLTEKRGEDGFTAEDEEIAVALASAAGVVIENARLYEESERQRQWMAATTDIANALLKPISREAAKQLIADRARDVSSAAVTAVLTPADDGGGRLLVRAVAGMDEGLVGRSPGPSLLLESVVAGEQAALVVDAASDERYDLAPLDGWPRLSSLHAFPLPLNDGTGVLVMGWLEDSQAPSWALDATMPEGFAREASLVMQVVRAQEDQARLAVFEDRDRIGRDLHDLVIQRLFAVGLMLDSTSRIAGSDTVRERLSGAVDDLDQTIKEIRRTIFDLSTPLAPSDLRTAMSEVLADAQRLLGFRPGLETVGPVESVVTDVVAEHLLVALREIVSNVVRHAGAGRVDVRLDVTGDVELVVADDGHGLADDDALGNGLRNLRHRAANLGGTCTFETGADGGLTVRWRVPRELP